jgi:superfamily I DNA/RNA helicase
LDPSKVAELERRLGLQDAASAVFVPENEETISKLSYSEDVPPDTELGSHPEAINPEPLVVEPMEDWELVSLLATPDLLRRFASLAQWPTSSCEALLACKTSSEICSLPSVAPDQLENLLTFLTENRHLSDIERCWMLPDGDIKTVAERPLESFLLFLDDDQKALVDKPLDVGPFLVRGTAGTGKSTVCLYRMRRMIEQRFGESLFDASGKPRYLFATYTNQLTSTSEKLFSEICRGLNLDQVSVEFKTVDKLIAELASELKAHGIRIPDVIDGQDGLYKSVVDSIKPGLSNELIKAIEDEIEEVIFDRGLSCIKDYMAAKRRGRAQINKELVWCVYEALTERLANLGRATWAGRRRRILDEINSSGVTVPQRKFSGIVIDEAQDLGMTSLAILARCAVNTKAIMLASDTGQSIYRRGPNWKSIDERFVFNRSNSFELKRSYRMSKEIFRALEPLRMIQNESMRNIQPEPVFSGAMPRMHFCDSRGHARLAAQIILEQARLHGFHLGTFAVLVGSTKPKRTEVLRCTFEEEGIPFKVQDKHTPIDPLAKEVHIITPHSGKGLEFPNVIVPWPDSLGSITEEEEANAKLHRLLYVACSRAAENLWLIRHPNSGKNLCDVFEDDFWNVERHEKFTPDAGV